MIAWVTAKLQDEPKQGVHSANRGVAPPRMPTHVNKDVKKEAIMGIIRGGKIRPEAARTNLVDLVEPRSMRCQRRTGRSGLPLVEFWDLTASCSSTPRDLEATHGTKNQRAIMPERRIGATITAHVKCARRL